MNKKDIDRYRKKRKSLGWTGSVTLASIFSDSILLHDAIGGDMADFIIAVAFKEVGVYCLLN